MKARTEEELRGPANGVERVRRWVRGVLARPVWTPVERPLPPGWLAHVEEVRLARGFDAERTAKFRSDLSVLCNAIDVTSPELPVDDRMRVILCGTAAVIITGREPRWLDHISRFTVHREPTRGRDGEYQGREHPLLGLAGLVQVAWSEVEYDAKVTDDGSNVMLHELAHAIDHRFGGKLLQRDARADRWRSALRDLVETWSEARSVAGAELFAIATELFFERPRDLQAQEPDLYAELVAIYAADPGAWS